MFPVGLGKLLYDSTVDTNDSRRRLGLRQPQPLVNFALCYGTRSSPTLRYHPPPTATGHSQALQLGSSGS